MYTLEDVKNLRTSTGAGFADCKKALEASKGDMDGAIDWLRKNGTAKAAKKESRIAAEGLTNIVSDGNTAIILEVNSETDFVAKNEKFKKFVDDISEALLKSDVTTMEDALNVKTSEGTIQEYLVNMIATIGEKLSFRRFEVVEKNDDEIFGSYLHLGGKIASLVVLNGGNEEVAKDVAMQDAAMSPVGVTREDIPEEMVEREKEVIKEQIKNDEKNAKKPEDVIEKMAVGKLNKFYKEVCLVEQEFIKDSSLTIEKYLESNNATIVKACRYAVGEGIEKRQEDFASEVMSQIQNA